jgi:hypothetical protein
LGCLEMAFAEGSHCGQINLRLDLFFGDVKPSRCWARFSWTKYILSSYSRTIYELKRFPLLVAELWSTLRERATFRCDRCNHVRLVSTGRRQGRFTSKSTIYGYSRAAAIRNSSDRVSRFAILLRSPLGHLTGMFRCQWSPVFGAVLCTR